MIVRWFIFIIIILSNVETSNACVIGPNKRPPSCSWGQERAQWKHQAMARSHGLDCPLAFSHYSLSHPPSAGRISSRHVCPLGLGWPLPSADGGNTKHTALFLSPLSHTSHSSCPLCFSWLSDRPHSISGFTHVPLHPSPPPPNLPPSPSSLTSHKVYLRLPCRGLNIQSTSSPFTQRARRRREDQCALDNIGEMSCERSYDAKICKLSILLFEYTIF